MHKLLTTTHQDGVTFKLYKTKGTYSIYINNKLIKCYEKSSDEEAIGYFEDYVASLR